ncbi:hypothetical protein N7456_002350 [Penicillium angulare]|uniref:Uncharacterized protein n=1 Tax=Penicillium angulare TaxID=116970 RepID=A0A9W9G808_9EURO|nr:hypothetical protein N7456_002350 [Penicillium angulare]
MQRIKKEDEGSAPPIGIKRRSEMNPNPTPNPPESSWLWSTNEVGYFYPKCNTERNGDEDTDMDEHFRVVEKDPSHATIFFNAEAFVSHLRGLIVFKPARTVQANIHLCLRADALDWYNTELSDAEREGLRDLPLEHKKGWFNQILTRFNLSPNAARYYLTCFRPGFPVLERAHNIVRYARAAGINDAHQQVLEVWKYVGDNYPHHASRLCPPSQGTSLSEFMQELYVAEQDVLMNWGFNY